MTKYGAWHSLSRATIDISTTATTAPWELFMENLWFTCNDDEFCKMLLFQNATNYFERKHNPKRNKIHASCTYSAISSDCANIPTHMRNPLKYEHYPQYLTVLIDSHRLRMIKILYAEGCKAKSMRTIREIFTIAWQDDMEENLHIWEIWIADIEIGLSASKSYIDILPLYVFPHWEIIHIYSSFLFLPQNEHHKHRKKEIKRKEKKSFPLIPEYIFLISFNSFCANDNPLNKWIAYDITYVF